MALRSLIQLRGLFEGLPSGSINIAPPDIQNNTPPEFSVQAVLANGDNTIVVPVLAAGCIIMFDATSTTVKKLKGNAGDTGTTLSKTRWNVLTFDSPPPASLIINSSAADTGKNTTILFF